VDVVPDVLDTLSVFRLAASDIEKDHSRPLIGNERRLERECQSIPAVEVEAAGDGFQRARETVRLQLSDRTDPAGAARVDVGVRPCAQRVQRSEDQSPRVGRPPSRAQAGVGSIVRTERRRHFDGLEIPTAKRLQALPVESSKLRLIVGVIALEVRDRCRKQASALAELAETPNLS
jgi:hypothetical protein